MAEIRNRATLDSKPFQSELQKMQGMVQGFATNAAKALLPAFGVGMAVGLTKNLIATADEIDNLAGQTGLATDTLQSLKFATGEAGVEFGLLQASIQKMATQQAMALTGNKQAQQSFEALGISMDQLAGLNTEQLLEAVGRGLRLVDGNASAAAAMTRILGESALKLKATLIAASRDGFGAFNEAMSAFTADRDAIARLDELEQRFSRLTMSAKSFALEGLSAVVEKIQQVGAFLGAVSAGSDFLEAAAIAGEVTSVAPRAAAETASSPASEPAKPSWDSGTLTEEDVYNAEKALEFARMTDEQKQDALETELKLYKLNLMQVDTREEYVDTLKNIMRLESELARIKEATRREDEAEIKRQLDAIQKRREDEAKLVEEEQRIREQTSVSGFGSGAALERIGGFGGSGDSGAINAIERQIRIQEQIRDLTRRMGDILERNPQLTIGGE